MPAKKRANGAGSVYRKADGTWEAAMTIPGSRQRKRFSGRTHAEANRKLTEALRDRDRGMPVARDERLTLEQYLAGWLETMQPPRTEPKTHRRYRELVTLHILPTLGTVPLARLTPQQVQALYARALASGLSSTTVRKLHMVLHAALQAAVRMGMVPRNVTELVDKPRNAKTDIQPLAEPEARALLEAARGERYEALYVLALTTGMRQGELLALHWRDVDLDGATLSVRLTLQRTPQATGGLIFKAPKTPKSRRRIGLTPLAVSALRTHRAQQAQEKLRLGAAWAAGWAEHADLVFPSTIGTPLEGEHLTQRQFKPLLRRAGIRPVRFHDLRHTAATIGLSHNINPKIVSEMLGHSSIALTLDTYSHFLPHMQDDFVAAMQTIFGPPAREERRRDAEE